MKRIYLLLVLIAFASCSVVTPPTRLTKLETPEVLNEGESKIGIEAGLNGGIWLTDIATISGSYSFGLGDYRQISITGSYAKFDIYNTEYDEETDESTENYDFSPDKNYLFTGDIDYKFTTEKLKDILSFNMGGGFGDSDYGQVVSFHIGTTVGYVNKTLIPFLSLEYHINIPVYEKGIYTEADSWGDSTDEEGNFENFLVTHMFSGNLGLKIPAVNLSFGVHMGILMTQEDGALSVGFGLKYEY